jgi:hypothetical protein
VLAAPSLAHAAVPPVTWCGHDEVSADRAEQAPWYRDEVRFVYAVPSDGADHFFADASGIATDAAWIEAWWQQQDPTRAPRFALTTFPGCATQFGALDLGFIRLPHPASYYAAADVPARLLDADLAPLGLPEAQKTIVYYDGPSTNQDYCGVTTSETSSAGGAVGLVYVLLQSGCSLVPGQTTAQVAAHELIHNLGAVSDLAPNECRDNRGHVCDSTSDIMYPFLGPGTTIDDVALDVGRDDYYGHSGSWWDVQDSSWLRHLPLRRVHVTVVGQGQVAAKPSGLPCSGGCDTVLENGTAVSLVPQAASGWSFAGWQGYCVGAGSCAFPLQSDASITATFVRGALALRATLRVTVQGRGRVVSGQPAFSCSATCTQAVARGSSVRLTAHPAAGSRFAGWRGGCSGRGVCTVRLDRVRSVSATFVRQ